MNLAPLTHAPVAIQLHAYAAMAAFVLGVVQLAGVKGTSRHRALGYTWVALMLVVAISAFWIHEIRLWGPWSPIHLLAIFTLIMLPLGVTRARAHNVRGHHARDFFRGAGDRRALHVLSRPDHVQGGVRRLKSPTRAPPEHPPGTRLAASSWPCHRSRTRPRTCAPN